MKSLLICLILFTYAGNYTATGQHTLPKLPYAYNALEPYLDAQTMEIHYTRHHQAYVTNLNNALKADQKSLPVETLLANISAYPPAIRNNAGGHYNHTLFWTMLTPQINTAPSKQLFRAIENKFANLDSLKSTMNKAGLAQFGSGWVWLIVTPDTQLAVCSSPNQDNPLMDIAEKKGIPIIGIDLWEHAYYLKYQNKRGDYLDAIWKVLNWTEVSKLYDAAIK